MYARTLSTVFLLLATLYCVAQNEVPVFTIDVSPPKPAYDYESVKGDPIGVKIYTLKNGLKLYLSVNKAEPRIMTNIAVRAGSKFDPAETTGLAHYLEHMMFKGTDRLGALDWEKEAAMLQTISDLYETYRKTTDPESRRQIYAQIDSVSNMAANSVAANEYDKLVRAIGAKATNAYTWVEQTVYVNDIPSNEMERWMRLESERFRMVVLRLFHTELEAVYEEYNINQDRDFRKVFKAMGEELFPTHPYGQQSTIGLSEHLKNPSHVNIQAYFKKYYVPNNMAMVLSGDFNPDEVVAMAEKYWGDYGAAELETWKSPVQAPRTAVTRREVVGQESPYVQVGWRLGGVKTADPMMLTLISGLLYNGQAGLLDLDLVQQQRVLEAYPWFWNYEDYSGFGFQGKPREGQTVEEVEALLLAEMEKIKRGEFDEWLIDAVVKDFKLSRLRSYENNNGRVSNMTNAFILGLPWDYYVNQYDKVGQITKEQVLEFAKNNFQDNYAVVYKRSGTDKAVAKVEKPPITPVKLNRDKNTPFAEEILGITSKDIQPEFIDFSQAIKTVKLQSGIEMDYIQNTENDAFYLYYVWEMGKANDKRLPMALNYLTYLGTDKYTPDQLQQEFYKLGCSMDISSGEDVSYIYLTGLAESYEAALALMEHVLSNVKPDEAKWQNIVEDVMSKRVNAKKSKETILRSAMASYAKYGKASPFTDILSEAEMKALKPAELTDYIKSLAGVEHRLFYYGPNNFEDAQRIATSHRVAKKMSKVPVAKIYAELETKTDRVIFVNFTMTQAELMMLSKGTPKFSTEEYIMSELYNGYFGSGLSSIVFQEIRESKALAYSANAYYGSPSKTNRAHYFQAYVGTQADKLKDAVTAMRVIVEDMPVSKDQIEGAKISSIKRIESERIRRTNIYFTRRSNIDRGLNANDDSRKMLYNQLLKITPEDLIKFQQKNVKGRHYTIMVLGNKENIDMEYLKTLGPVEELTLEQVFGY